MDDTHLVALTPTKGIAMVNSRVDTLEKDT